MNYCVAFVWGEKLGWPRTLFVCYLHMQIADSCRAVQILITTSCSTYVKLFERGLNESFIASVFCDQELDGQG